MQAADLIWAHECRVHPDVQVMAAKFGHKVQHSLERHGLTRANIEGFADCRWCLDQPCIGIDDRSNVREIPGDLKITKLDHGITPPRMLDNLGNNEVRTLSPASIVERASNDQRKSVAVNRCDIFRRHLGYAI